MSHTPTPWKLKDNVIITDGGLRICFVCGEIGLSIGDDEANAAHIVRCVNAYPALVEALRFAVMTIDARDKERRLLFTNDELDKLRAALAAAETD